MLTERAPRVPALAVEPGREVLARRAGTARRATDRPRGAGGARPRPAARPAPPGGGGGGARRRSRRRPARRVRSRARPGSARRPAPRPRSGARRGARRRSASARPAAGAPSRPGARRSGRSRGGSRAWSRPRPRPAPRPPGRRGRARSIRAAWTRRTVPLSCPARRRGAARQRRAVGHPGQAERRAPFPPLGRERHPAAVVDPPELPPRERGEELGLGVVVPRAAAAVARQRRPAGCPRRLPGRRAPCARPTSSCAASRPPTTETAGAAATHAPAKGFDRALGTLRAEPITPRRSGGASACRWWARWAWWRRPGWYRRRCRIATQGLGRSRLQRRGGRGADAPLRHRP